MLSRVGAERTGADKGVMNASLIRHACGGVVKLTGPVILAETGLIYMLSVYHEGSVGCHLPASPA